MSVFFTISYKYIWTMYTTTEISKDLVDFRLVLMVVAALNSSLENSKFSLENLKELSFSSFLF